MKTRTGQLAIEVWADWNFIESLKRIGTLFVTSSRGGEVFSFEYDADWLRGGHVQILDPALRLFEGQQYAAAGRVNFGLFLDSCPDRWGRMLMMRREAQQARSEGRQQRRLLESDYLLGVCDGHRMGGLRFRIEPGGPFLDDNQHLALPPWTSLRELEQAGLNLERDDATEDPSYAKWLRMLMAPGGSLGGARPKAGVSDENGAMWIAKFPSRQDDDDVGAWEMVVNLLARDAGVTVPITQARKFASSRRTFLSRRFDRTDDGRRVHFASALTLLQRDDGDDAAAGASYLELAELLMRAGAHTERDLQELWRRIVFFICISNTDDHLRNHGFLLGPEGWSLAPAYDMNPEPHGSGLRLNISETDNALDLELALEVAPYFRLGHPEAGHIVSQVVNAVRRWPETADSLGLGTQQQERMAPAFVHAIW